MQTKICTKCKESFPKDERYFFFDKRGWYRPTCRKCYSDQNRAWREKNKEYKRLYDKIYSDNNKDKSRERTLKNRDRVRVKSICKVYNTTEKFIQEKMNSQRGCCEICGDSLVHKDSTHSYSIDHNHSTGDIRGLLCPACNTSLGLLKEDTNILDNMKRYIKKYNG